MNSKLQIQPLANNAALPDPATFQNTDEARHNWRDIPMDADQYEEAFSFAADSNNTEARQSHWVRLSWLGQRVTGHLSYEYDRNLGIEGLHIAVKR